MSESSEEIQFTEEEVANFQNLLTLGALSKSWNILGHTLVLRTLTTGENIEVGRVIKDYESAFSFQAAMKTALLAASIVSIDGELLIAQLGPGERKPSISDKFEIVKDYYPGTIDKFYQKFTELEQELVPILEKLGKA